ncbi:MAG: 12-oxophytodienoate reductase [Phenylobacterium sp.]|uniref:oxidoreductase n=1 Tax=Phenylobacterium sp. TaxID=1871053 RepID=UPI002732ECF1|nr:12-oxophytodienoate reductase [Phenylobacterium sp.]MDP3747680.1 12-oxophytodienoate reductase [Phenylobacterium sp.]
MPASPADCRQTEVCDRPRQIEAAIAPLFEPFTVNGLTLPNRIAMAPMGRHFSRDGRPSDDYVAYYARRAAGGVGLVTSEATPVPHPAAAHAPTYSAYHGEGPLSVWGRVPAAVQGAGGKYMQQLFHVGGLRRAGDLPHPDAPAVSPSGLYQPATGTGEPPQLNGRPATESELADVVTAFGQAAADAQRLGCDGVNLHAAHGYLLDQFLWPTLNRREDGHGRAHPTRLAEEVVREVRRRVGPAFPIFLRISQWKQQDYAARLWEEPKALEAFLRPLIDAGVDLFDCSTRRFWTPEFQGSDLNLAGWVKKLSGVPTMTVGSVGLDRDLFEAGVRRPEADDGPSPNTGGLGDFAGPASLDRVVAMLERSDFDLVAVGRALISNPNWANDIRAGATDRIRAFEKVHLASLE